MIAEAVNFQAGDTVADIGTADGLFIAALSMYTDSLTFFLEDIDSIWNRSRFDSALQAFSAKSSRSPSNRFYYSTGNERSSGLPSKTFDKVLIIDTYHHFTHRDEMITDAMTLLKPGGKIIVMEALARMQGDIHHGCKENIFTYDEIVSFMASKGMRLDKSKFIHKVARRDNTLFVFSKM